MVKRLVYDPLCSFAELGLVCCPVCGQFAILELTERARAAIEFPCWLCSLEWRVELDDEGLVTRTLQKPLKVRKKQRLAPDWDAHAY